VRRTVKQLFVETRRLLLVTASLGILSLFLVSFPQVSEAQLVFRRVTENESLYRGDPSRYDRDTSGENILFIEKIPALIIPFTDIEKLMVERKRTPLNDKEMFAEILCDQRPSRCPWSERATGEPYYNVNFKFSPASGERLAKLTRLEKGNHLEIRLGSQLLSRGKVIDEIRDSLSISKSDITENELKAILGPLNDRLTWE
jgi:hypothetical protein